MTTKSGLCSRDFSISIVRGAFSLRAPLFFFRGVFWFPLLFKRFYSKHSNNSRDCCIKANRCVAFGIRLWSHTEVCFLLTSPSAPCASSFLQSLDNLASKIVRLLSFATVSCMFLVGKFGNFLCLYRVARQ